jgi:hypothetical protein
MSPNIPMVEVAPATSFEATIVSWFTELNDGRGGPVEVRVNGEVIREGQLSAQVLAELGIVTRDLDDLWGDFVMANGWPIIQYSGLPGTPQMPDYFAVENQQGACWELHATVDPAQGVQTVRDLAYVDLAHVNRMVTFKLRQWNKLTIGDAAARDHDLSRNRWSWIVSRTQRLEPGSAVGSWYSGINQSEIDATFNTAHSLEAARRELDKALDEINIAIRVADAAWKGDRADAAKYKFCLESTIIESIRDVTHGWEDFTQDVVRL